MENENKVVNIQGMQLITYLAKSINLCDDLELGSYGDLLMEIMYNVRTDLDMDE